MKAVDTNILVRLLTADDAKQFAIAQAVLHNPVWIAKRILLRRHGSLGKCTNSALGLVDNGIEFADAFHLCSRPVDTAFASFDSKLVRRARREGMANTEIAGEGRTARN